jgi:hypothetical protein
MFFNVKRLLIIIPVFSLFLSVSCSARINGSVAADGSANMALNMALEPRFAALVSRVAAAGGQAPEHILDGQAIAVSMSQAPGIASVTLTNYGPAAVQGNVRLSSLGDFLSAARGFIVFEPGRCEININRDNGSVVLASLSAEIAEYLNALMAPVVTGEEMTKTEYLALVASFYNRAISDEIASSRIRASIDFPGQITNVRGGTYSGRRAEFDIPLLDLLVLDTPLVYEVRWR